jgi:hypothetical protein
MQLICLFSPLWALFPWDLQYNCSTRMHSFGMEEFVENWPSYFGIAFFSWVFGWYSKSLLIITIVTDTTSLSTTQYRRCLSRKSWWGEKQKGNDQRENHAKETSWEFTDRVCIIRGGEKYLLAKANYCLKCFEDVQSANRPTTSGAENTTQRDHTVHWRTSHRLQKQYLSKRHKFSRRY